MKHLTSLIGAALVLAVTASGARAEGFGITEWSARGMALAGGMVARADDASAVAYNPAGITQLPGTTLMFGSALSLPSGSIETRVTCVKAPPTPTPKRTTGFCRTFTPPTR